MLGSRLPAGGAWLPNKVHSKLKDKRPSDYNFVMAHMNHVLRRPDYVGVDAHHPGHINLVGVTLGSSRYALLVSVDATRNKQGKYTVVTAYPFERAKVESRVSVGALKSTKKVP